MHSDAPGSEQSIRLKMAGGRPAKRALLEFGRDSAECTEHELIVQREPGIYTDAYRALTHDLLLGV